MLQFRTLNIPLVGCGLNTALQSFHGGLRLWNASCAGWLERKPTRKHSAPIMTWLPFTFFVKKPKNLTTIIIDKRLWENYDTFISLGNIWLINMINLETLQPHFSNYSSSWKIHGIIISSFWKIWFINGAKHPFECLWINLFCPHLLFSSLHFIKSSMYNHLQVIII